MTETPQGRNRRADRHPRVEEAAPKAASRSRQPRAPIGRSQELMEACRAYLRGAREKLEN